VHKKLRYQDYVIADGKLIADWEGLYTNFEDPWHQSRIDHIMDSRRIIALNWCIRLRSEYQTNRIIDIGCGLGHLTNSLHKQNFEIIGIDVSKTAIQKARSLYPSANFLEGTFENLDELLIFDADIYIMSEITWYILGELDNFLSNIRQKSMKRKRPIYLIHLLTTYKEGMQKYGIDKFTNLNEILEYFNMNYLESGFIRSRREDDIDSQGTYFIGKITG